MSSEQNCECWYYIHIGECRLELSLLATAYITLFSTAEIDTTILHPTYKVVIWPVHLNVSQYFAGKIGGL